MHLPPSCRATLLPLDIDIMRGSTKAFSFYLVKSKQTEHTLTYHTLVQGRGSKAECFVKLMRIGY